MSFIFCVIVKYNRSYLNEWILGHYSTKQKAKEEIEKEKIRNNPNLSDFTFYEIKIIALDV